MSARGPRRMALGLAAALAAPLALVPSLAAGSTTQLRVVAATVSQGGRSLVWSARLNASFSPAALRRQKRPLCLRLNARARGEQLCVIGPARGAREPRLVEQRLTNGAAGRARVLPAVVTRADARQITLSFPLAAAGLTPRVWRWQITQPGPVFPARPRSLRLHVPVVAGCVASGPSPVFGGAGGRREVALTFDDGPWGTPPTSAFLGVLEREHAVATFFEIGDQISTYDPQGRLERRMLADGDFIGDHTWSHPMMTRLSAVAQRQQLIATADAIRRATGGLQTCLWRPPYGDVNGPLVGLARSLGLLTVMWDVDTRDWSLPGASTIYDRAVAGAHSGAIVLQHFGGGPRYETLDALPREIATLRARGYRLVTIPQLLGLRVIYR